MRDPQITEFLAHGPWAVAGASRNRDKYGNKVLRAYLQAGKKVYCLNPNEAEVEGQRCYPKLSDLPEPVAGLSIVTPPAVTERLVEEAHAAGVNAVWMQPGAESEAAIAAARARGMKVIAGGPCVLVAMGYREERG